MSEFWVSKKKYFCKYCEIYIADDAPSRNQHETGLRHIGNRDRFIRGLYKDGEKKKKDLEDAKREMAAVEKAAQAAYANDVSSGLVKQTHSGAVASTSQSEAAKSAKKPQGPSNPFVNYSSAASLGYTDPDADLLDLRQTQGQVGEWQVVTAPPAPESQPTASLKREADTAVAEEDTRQFKLRKKTLTTGLGQIYDPGVIHVRLKKKEEEVDNSLTPNIPTLPSSTAPTYVDDRPTATEAPTWKSVAWTKAGDVAKVEKREENVKAEEAECDGVDPQPKQEAIQPVESITVKPDPDPDAPPAPSLFKKRKGPPKNNTRAIRP